MTLVCGAINRDSVSPFRFPLLNHVHVISCAIFSVCHMKDVASSYLKQLVFIFTSSPCSFSTTIIAQSAGAVEYADCFSAEG